MPGAYKLIGSMALLAAASALVVAAVAMLDLGARPSEGALSLPDEAGLEAAARELRVGGSAATASGSPSAPDAASALAARIRQEPGPAPRRDVQRTEGRLPKAEWLAAGLPEDHAAFQEPGDWLPANVGIARSAEPPPRTMGGVPPVVFEELRRDLARKGVVEPTDEDVLAFIADQNARVRALNEALWKRRNELRDFPQRGEAETISPLERELIQRYFLGSGPSPDGGARERGGTP